MQTSLLPLISGCLGSTFAATSGTIIAARVSWGYQPSGSWSTIYLESEAIHIVVRDIVRQRNPATGLGDIGVVRIDPAVDDRYRRSCTVRPANPWRFVRGCMSVFQASSRDGTTGGSSTQTCGSLTPKPLGRRQHPSVSPDGVTWVSLTTEGRC